MWGNENQNNTSLLRKLKDKQASKQTNKKTTVGRPLLAVAGTHQRDDGALGGELRGAEQRPDKAVDLLLLGVVLVVIRGDL